MILALCIATVVAGTGLWSMRQGGQPPSEASRPEVTPSMISQPSPVPMTTVDMLAHSDISAIGSLTLRLGLEDYHESPTSDADSFSVKVQENHTRVVQALDTEGRVMALAPVLASSFFTWTDQPIDYASTAVAKLLLTPGFATGDANADVFVVAAAYRSGSQLARAARAIQVAARDPAWFNEADPEPVQVAMRQLAGAVEEELGVMASSLGQEVGGLNGEGGARASFRVRIDQPQPKVPCRPAPESSYEIVMPDALDGDGACLVGIEELESGRLQLTFENHASRWLSVNARITESGVAQDWALCQPATESQCSTQFVAPSAYSILTVSGLADVVLRSLMAASAAAGQTGFSGALDRLGALVAGVWALDAPGAMQAVTSFAELPEEAARAAAESAYNTVLATYQLITNARQSAISAPAPSQGQALVVDSVGWTVGENVRSDQLPRDPSRERLSQVLTLYSVFVEPAITLVSGARPAGEGSNLSERASSISESKSRMLAFITEPDTINALSEITAIVNRLATGDGSGTSMSDIARLADVVVPLMSRVVEDEAASLLSGVLLPSRGWIAVIDTVANSINYMVGIAQWSFAMDEYDLSDVYTVLLRGTPNPQPTIEDIPRLLAADPVTRGSDIGLLLPDRMDAVLGISVDGGGHRIVYGSRAQGDDRDLCLIAAESGPGTGVMGPAVQVPCGERRTTVQAADPCAGIADADCLEQPMADITGDGVLDRVAMWEPEGPCDGDPITGSKPCTIGLRVTDGPDRLLLGAAVLMSDGMPVYLGAADVDGRPGRELAVGSTFGQSLPTVVFAGPSERLSSALRPLQAPEPFDTGFGTTDASGTTPPSQTWHGPFSTLTRGVGWRSAPDAAQGTIEACKWSSQGWERGPFDLVTTRYARAGQDSWRQVGSAKTSNGEPRRDTPDYCFGGWFSPSAIAPRSGTDAPAMGARAIRALFDKLHALGDWGFASGDKMRNSRCATISWMEDAQTWNVRGSGNSKKRCRPLQVPDFSVTVHYNDRGVLSWRYSWEDAAEALPLNP